MDGRELYDELTDDLLDDPLVGRSTMMGHPCVRYAGRFFGSFATREDALVVKLPRDRVAALVEAGEGDAFAPAGKVFREWVLLARPDRALWSRLLDEALLFAKTN